MPICIKNPKKCTYIALQQNVSYTIQKTHKRVCNQLKELYMIQVEKHYQQVEKYVKDAYQFWLDVAIDTLKMLKTK